MARVVIKRGEVSHGIRLVRRELMKVQASLDSGDLNAAYAAAETAQFAAFNLKSYLSSGDASLMHDEDIAPRDREASEH